MITTPNARVIGLLGLSLGLSALVRGQLDTYWVMYPVLVWTVARSKLGTSCMAFCVSVVAALAFNLEHLATRAQWVAFSSHTLLFGAGCAVVYGMLAQHRQRERVHVTAKEQLQIIVDTKPQALCLISADGLISYANLAFCEEMGFLQTEVVGANLTSFIHPDDVATFKYAILALEDGTSHCSLSYRIVHKDGRTVALYRDMRPCFNQHHQLVNVQVLAHEDPENRAEMAKLREVNRQQELMLNSLNVGVLKTRHQEIIWQNKAAAQMLGYSSPEIFLKPGRMLYFDDASYNEVRQQALAAIAHDQEFTSQMKLRKKSGDPVWVDVKAFRISKETYEYLWLMLDVTQKKQYQDQIEHIAFYDALTGLPNRLLLADRLNC